MRPALTATVAAAAFAFAAASTWATLPPPTPQEQAAAAEKKAMEEARLKQEKVQLERVQDEVAARYKRAHPGQGGQGASGGPGVNPADLPKDVKVGPGDNAPHGGTKQSAEAHSAPAK
jgi:hypothetical protein